MTREEIIDKMDQVAAHLFELLQGVTDNDLEEVETAVGVMGFGLTIAAEKMNLTDEEIRDHANLESFLP